MVSNITSLTNNGLRDWLVQRVTAIVLAVYTLTILIFLFSHAQLQYLSWYEFMSCTVMRIASTLAVISLLFHAWVGMWTISTDYMKCTVIRLSFQVFVIIALFAYLIWGVAIVWGA